MSPLPNKEENMLKRTLAITISLLLLVGLMASPAAAKMKAPVVTLERVEVAHSWEFSLNTKEKTGSPMDLAFVFAVTNPNRTAIMLDEVSFTMSFEGFELMMPVVYEDIWLAGKGWFGKPKTSYIRVHATFDAYTTLLALLVPAPNVMRLKKLGVKHVDLIKKWWTEIGDFKFPIEVTNGTAKFADGKGNEVLSHFSAKWPK
jgi:hypothetical protein